MQIRVIIALVVVLLLGSLFGYQEYRIMHLQNQLSVETGNYNTLKANYDTAVNNYNALKISTDSQNAQVQKLHDDSVALQGKLDAASLEIKQLEKSSTTKVIKVLNSPAPTTCTQALPWVIDNTKEILSPTKPSN